MKKRTVKFLISGMLILSLMLAVFNFSAFAQDANTLASGEWGDLSWTLDRSGNLTVSGEGPMNDFDAFLANSTAWDNHYKTIKSVTIESGVTSIGDNAFRVFEKLVSVKIPDSVTKIGEDAFYACKSIKNIELGGGVKTIEDEAFMHCESLENIILPSGLESIGKYAFYDAHSLKEIVIPDSVTSVGEYAFSGNNSLISASIGDGVTALEKHVFSGCTALREISLSENLVSIGEGSFAGCVALMSVTIPEGVESIGEEAFVGCDRLVEVINKSSLELTTGEKANGHVAYYALEVHDGESKLENVDGYVFYTCESGTYLIDYDGEGTALTLPADHNGNAYDIYSYAFAANVKIVSVVIPNSVKHIGNDAFHGCIALKSVTLPNDLTRIEERTFYACEGLTLLDLPDSLTYIGGGAFASCKKLEGLEIPDGVTEIGRTAFNACDSLKSITIPKGVTTIESYTFSYCISLDSIVIPSNVRYLGAGVFEGCTSLKVIYVDSKSVASSMRSNASSGRALDNVEVILFESSCDDADPFILDWYPEVERIHCEGGEYTSYSKHSHDWKNSQCSVCKITKCQDDAAHTYVTVATESTHFEECFCGDKKNESDHNDANADGLCDTCEYSIKKSDNGKAKSGGCKSVLAVGSASAVLFVSAGALLIMKKKKRR